MKMKFFTFLLVFSIFFISPVLALTVDIPVPINSSTIPTVNNTEYFQGYTPTTLWTDYTGLGNDLWYSIDNPHGFYNSSTLDLSDYLLNTGDTATGDYTFDGTITANHLDLTGLDDFNDFGYSPTYGLNLPTLYGSTNDINLVLGSYNIAHRADDWHTVTNTGISNSHRLYSPGNNYAQWADGKTTAITEVNFADTLGTEVYGLAVFQIRYNGAARAILSNVKIEWYTAGGSWTTVYDDLPTTFAEGYFIYKDIIGYGDRGSRFKITSTLSQAADYPDESLGMISVSLATQDPFSSVVMQGGDIFIPLRVGQTNGNKGYIEFGDNIPAYFGIGSDSSIYYDGTNMIFNPKEVGSGQLKVLGDLNVTTAFTGSCVNVTYSGGIAMSCND